MVVRGQGEVVPVLLILVVQVQVVLIVIPIKSVRVAPQEAIMVELLAWAVHGETNRGGQDVLLAVVLVIQVVLVEKIHLELQM